MVNWMRQKWVIAFAIGFFGGAVFAQPNTLGQPPKKVEDQKMDEEVEAWVNTLLKRIADKNPTIRESARAAIASVGKPAIATLRKASGGDDKQLADAAKEVIRQIEEQADGIAKLPKFPGGGLPMFPGGGAPKGGRFVDEAMNGLKLTEAKEAKVKEVLTNHSKRILESIQKVLQGGKPDPMAIQNAIQKIHDDIIKDLEGTLSKEELEMLRKNLDRGAKLPALPGGPPK